MRRLIAIISFSIVFVFASISLAQTPTTIALSQNDESGQFLVDEAGNTLYIFTVDAANSSSCAGDCLTNWPPLTIESADSEIVADGIAGSFSVIERDDTGGFQVTYNRLPLYYFAGDEAAGDTNGEGRGDVWFVARPQLLTLSSNADTGSYLSDASGISLYIFSNDGDGISNCSGDCLTNWPPFTVSNIAELNAGFDVLVHDGLDVIERADTGALQVTYQGMPLYYFANDATAGDINGQGRGDVWFLLNPTVLSVSGDMLIGRDGTTLYTFANDEPGVSNCVDMCASIWHPLLVASEADLDGISEALRASVSVIERADSTLQVVYNGQPLYYFINDLNPGDTNGDGRGDVWFVASAAAMTESSADVCTVSPSGNVNLRSGPGTNYAIAGSLLSTDTATVAGQANGADGFVWWLLNNGSWVRSDIVSEEGACDTVPVAAIPPAPVQATPVPAQPTSPPEESNPPPAQPTSPPQPTVPPPATTEDP